MVDAIVLSAGRASRFGVPKFLLPAGEGHVLLTRVLEAASSVVDGRMVVVLGRASKVARYAVESWVEATAGAQGSRVHMVLNRNYRYGQSTSLKAGIRRLGDTKGALILLADMPAIEPTRLVQMREAIQTRAPRVLAVAASAQGRIRPPVYLSAELFPEIGRLKGDQGARAILSALQRTIPCRDRPLTRLLTEGQLEKLEWEDGLWCTDIDDWPTYRYLAYQMGWAKELFVSIPHTRVSPAQVKAMVDMALASAGIPWLAPGLLLLPGKGEAQWLNLTSPYRGVWGIVVGRSSTPATYLQLLRRAALSALAAGA